MHIAYNEERKLKTNWWNRIGQPGTRQISLEKNVSTNTFEYLKRIASSKQKLEKYKKQYPQKNNYVLKQNSIDEIQSKN